MEARLAFLGHALMENHCGLLVDACLTPATGHAERIAALAMIEPHADRPVAVTLGADKGYDAADFVNELRTMNVRPHVAQNTTRHRGRSAIAATARPPRRHEYRTLSCDRDHARYVAKHHCLICHRCPSAQGTALHPRGRTRYGATDC
jgi:hypothetical protein